MKITKDNGQKFLTLSKAEYDVLSKKYKFIRNAPKVTAQSSPQPGLSFDDFADNHENGLSFNDFLKEQGHGGESGGDSEVASFLEQVGNLYQQTFNSPMPDSLKSQMSSQVSESLQGANEGGDDVFSTGLEQPEQPGQPEDTGVHDVSNQAHMPGESAEEPSPLANDPHPGMGQVTAQTSTPAPQQFETTPQPKPSGTFQDKNKVQIPLDAWKSRVAKAPQSILQAPAEMMPQLFFFMEEMIERMHSKNPEKSNRLYSLYQSLLQQAEAKHGKIDTMSVDGGEHPEADLNQKVEAPIEHGDEVVTHASVDKASGVYRAGTKFANGIDFAFLSKKMGK